MSERNDYDLTQIRSRYLDILLGLSHGEEGMQKWFLKTYKLYVETYREEYQVYHFVDALYHIRRFPQLDRWFWQMFIGTWKQLTESQKETLIEDFPSMSEYRWLLEPDSPELMMSEPIETKFIPRAFAIAVASIVTEKFDPTLTAKVASAHHDFVWIDFNFDMRDYDRITRNRYGWGIFEHSANEYWPEGEEPQNEEFLRLLKLLVSFDPEQKSDFLGHFESFSDVELHRYIDDFYKEVKAVFLMDHRYQNHSIAKAISKRQSEWNEIMSLALLHNNTEDVR
ncbi:MAG: hypothetical protein PHQ22_09125 [Sulfuricurvum sp.]|nr:hypothetical protein [Sulfuricurvum sp.]